MTAANFRHRLKHCPFCGEFVRILVHDLDDQCYVECETCRALGPTGGDLESAVFQWNYRSKEAVSKKCIRCGKNVPIDEEMDYRMCVGCRHTAANQLQASDFGSGVVEKMQAIGKVAS